MIDTIATAQDQLFVERVNDEALVIELRAILEQASPFEGYVGDLFKRILGEGRRPDPSLPKTAAHLSSLLERLRPAMARAGIAVEFLQKTRRGKRIRIRLTEPFSPTVPSAAERKGF